MRNPPKVMLKLFLQVDHWSQLELCTLISQLLVPDSLYSHLNRSWTISLHRTGSLLFTYAPWKSYIKPSKVRIWSRPQRTHVAKFKVRGPCVVVVLARSSSAAVHGTHDPSAEAAAVPARLPQQWPRLTVALLMRDAALQSDRRKHWTNRGSSEKCNANRWIERKEIFKTHETDSVSIGMLHQQSHCHRRRYSVLHICRWHRQSCRWVPYTFSLSILRNRRLFQLC